MSADAQAIQARLRWRCRRGTRELDAMLGAWLDMRYATAAAALRDDFAALLDCADPDLWNWLIGQSEPPARFAAIVADIRANDIANDINVRHRV